MDRTVRIPLDQLWPRAERPTAAVEVGAERAILRSAIEMFGRQGYGGTSTRSVAAAASVTAPLIGYHFGSKEGLFRECVDLVVGGIVERALEIFDEPLPFEETVRRFAELHIQAAHAHPHALRFALSIAYGPEEGQPEIDLFGYWQPVIHALAARMHHAIEGGEFEPRAGTTLPGLVQHLIHAVHFEVFAAYERERFGKRSSELVEAVAPVAVSVGEVVAQFFHGAGTLARRPEPMQEDR